VVFPTSRLLFSRMRKQTHSKGRKSSKRREDRNFHASRDLVIYKDISHVSPFPPRYRTSVTTALRGYINSGTGAVTWYCKMNSAHLPFVGGGWPNALPVVTTLKPTGFPQVCNATFYTLFRVLKSKIRIQVSPGDAADSVQVTVTPSGSSSEPASAAIAMGQRRTKWKQVQIGTPMSSQTVTNEVSQADFLGVPDSAIENDLSGDFIGSYNSDPAVTMFWVVNWTPDNAGVSSTVCSLSIILEQEIEFFGETAASQPEALVVTGTPVSKATPRR